MKNKYCFETFGSQHIEEARKLVGKAYMEEQQKVPILPLDAEVPPLDKYADNKLGVAALSSGRLVGFLCCLSPWDNFFGTSKGTFVPVNAHATVKEERNKIYSLLYQYASEVWVRNGILSQAIGVYTQDTQAVESFFENGFGLRTIDAVRSLEPIKVSDYPKDIIFHELEIERFPELLPQLNNLIEHLNGSPNFMPHSKYNEKEFKKQIDESPRRYFVAEKAGRLIGHIKITTEGESFIGDTEYMINIQGAYLEEEFRGSGIYKCLLDYTIRELKKEGYIQLGVDFESFNPTARRFWLKFFTPYIYGMTRRIDERISSFYE